MFTKVSATLRDERGKNSSRRLRVDGKIPAVAYGGGEPALALTVSPEDVKTALYGPHGVNAVVELEVSGGASVKAMIADYQYHPVSRTLLHADFIRVSDTAEVTVNVPLELTGRSKGVVMGGTLRQVFRELPLKCVPSKIPVKVVYDVTNLDLDQHVSAADLQLPEGVEILLPAKRTVASVAIDKHAKKEEEAEAAAAEAAKKA
jgi:large subunit ribosomal protein L25